MKCQKGNNGELVSCSVERYERAGNDVSSFCVLCETVISPKEEVLFSFCSCFLVEQLASQTGLCLYGTTSS